MSRVLSIFLFHSLIIERITQNITHTEINPTHLNSVKNGEQSAF